MKPSRGFALIELMVVVAVLSVAAAYIVPRFLRHQTQKKQEECRTNLLSLAEAEKNYHRDRYRYTDDVSALAWRPEGKGHYEYRFLSSPQDLKHGFLFECFGNIDKDPKIDRATIDETGQMILTSDDTKE